MKYYAMLAALSLSVLPVSPVVAQANDVSPDHWAYQAVQSLAAKGLVLGYPDGNFLGPRSLTRYEMATIVKRIMDHLDASGSTATVAAPIATQPDSRPVGVTSFTTDELDEVRKLVEEYKTELTVIGADLSSIKGKLEEHDAKFISLEEAINDPEGPVMAASNDIANLKKLALTGFVQFWNVSRSDSKSGIQPGGVTGNQDSFTTRRARLKATYTVRDFNQYVLQLAADRGNSVTMRDAYFTLPVFKANSLDQPLTLTAGQFNVPFGFEISQSDTDREFPERTRGEGKLFPGERDRGVQFSGSLGNRTLQYWLAVVNGGGISDSGPTGSVDQNDRKDVSARLLYAPPHGTLEFGVSAYNGKSNDLNGLKDSANKALYSDHDRTRYGAELRFYGIPDTAIKGEYWFGKEYNASRLNSANFRSWYGQITRNIDSKTALAVRYDSYDPDTGTPLAGTPLNNFVAVPTLGFLIQRAINTNTKLTLAYEMPRLPDPKNSSPRPKQNLLTSQLMLKF